MSVHRSSGSSAGTYPSTLPCPSIAGYNFSLAHDITESKMQNGWTVRRQREPYPIRTVNLSFEVGSSGFFDWYDYCVNNAYTWISINVQTDITVGGPVSRERLRFVSPISYSYSDWDVIKANVQAEFYVDEQTGGLS